MTASDARPPRSHTHGLDESCGWNCPANADDGPHLRADAPGRGNDGHRLTDTERDALARAIDRADDRWQRGIGSGGYDVNGPPLWLVDAPETLAAVEAIVAARQESVKALADEFPTCWITRLDDGLCTDFIGAKFGGGVFVQEMCCLPCRIRSALANQEGTS